MKNYFIWLSVFTILMLALIDASERIKELKVSVQTPSQVEMKQHLNNNEVRSDSLDFERNRNKQNVQNSMRERAKHNLQDNIDDMNNRQYKRKQSHQSF